MDQYPFNYVLRFGPHKGKSLGTIIQSERRYLESCLKQSWVYPDTKRAIELILKNQIEITPKVGPLATTNFSTQSVVIEPGLLLPSRYDVPLVERTYGLQFGDMINFTPKTIMHSMEFFRSIYPPFE